MSSIITNQSAMVALDTLKGINKNLGMVQNEISTGKSINSARDNAAIWSISTVMESDANGFEQISDSLNLGASTVGVARTASEGIVEDVQEIRNLIISAQEDNVDRAKIQTDIDNLVEEISSKVSGAQFNGLNLLNNSDDVNILSSLDRGSDGTVTAQSITVSGQNLVDEAGTTQTVQTGNGVATFNTLSPSGSNTDDGTFISIATVAAGDADGNVYSFDFGGGTVTYTADAGDDQDGIAAGIAQAINDAVTAGDITLPTGVSDVKATNGNVTVDVTDGNTAAATNTSQTEVVTAAGALNGLGAIDVTTDAGATAALTSIEGILNNTIDAAAEFGSKQKRIEGQADFVSSLADSLKVGVSTLTDANLEEASARLQALQVQQQLGVQALSIANQAPQALLSLFR